MKDKTKGFTPARIEDHARTADVVRRAKESTNAAIGQSHDRLGTIGGLPSGSF